MCPYSLLITRGMCPSSSSCLRPTKPTGGQKSGAEVPKSGAAKAPRTALRPILSIGTSLRDCNC